MVRTGFLAVILLGFATATLAGPQAGTAADSTVGPRPNVRLVIPVRRSKPASVRIKRVHDNRGVLIIRAPSAGVLLPDSLATMGLATSAQLEEMEARLMDYLDRSVFPPEEAGSLAARAAPLGPTPFAAKEQPVRRKTRVVPVPVPVPITRGSEAPDTVFVDSSAVSIAAAPDTSDTTFVPGEALEDTAGLAATVTEVERAILDTELFRTAKVLFETNKSELLPESNVVLEAVGVVLERHQQIRLEIRGHTDSRGPDEYNLTLSEARAHAVYRYLVEEHGIDPSRIAAAGYGESQPVADNDTPTGRALNRRVEFVVVD